MLSHSVAKALVDQLGVSPVESLFLRAVAWHETNYGGGWKPEKVKAWHGPPVAWKPGVTAPWNMGAITTLHPDALSFSHQDSRYDDKEGKVVQYVTWFAGDPTPEKGFERLADTVLRGAARSALAVSDVMEGVTQMHVNGYYLGIHSRARPQTDKDNIVDYYRAVVTSIASIGRETGEIQPDVQPPLVVQEKQ